MYLYTLRLERFIEYILYDICILFIKRSGFLVFLNSLEPMVIKVKFFIWDIMFIHCLSPLVLQPNILAFPLFYSCLVSISIADI